MTEPATDQRVADPGLPLLHAALDPERAARAFAAAKRYAGARVDVRRATLIRHKPGRRAVLLYDYVVTWPDGRRDVVEAVGKMRASRPPRSAYNLLRRLWQSGFDAASPDGISVPEPLAKVPELGLWLQRRVPGVVATSLLTTSQAVPLARRIADAAAKLHRSGIAADRTHDPDAEVAVLERVFDQVGQRDPRLRRTLSTLMARCRQVAARVTAVSTGIHRDFYPDQVVVDADRLYLLDFDLYCHGHAALDLGNFAGHLVEHALREPVHADVLSSAGDALEARYLAHAGDGARTAVRAYTALTLARHVALSQLLPGRAATTSLLVEATQTRLEALADAPA